MKHALRAREVWRDCVVASGRLEATENPPAFRITLVAACSLLRAIGHVLEKVDAGNDPVVEKRVGMLWKEMKLHRDMHALFWDFIEDERNILLKTYEHRYDVGGVDIVTGCDGAALVVSLEAELFKPIVEGPFAGLDIRDLVTQALDYWDTQLSRIEGDS